MAEPDERTTTRVGAVFVPQLPPERLRSVAATPGAALGSTRDKPDEAYCEKVLAGLRKAGADAFVYIGGNDTSGTQQILTDAASGACPAGTFPVYRLFNGRQHANHRYVTSLALRDSMVAAGWIAEGYGPAQVAMCSLALPGA